MKTKIYLSTLLALTIQVMVNGQTQGNQASQNKLGVILRHNTFGVNKIEAAQPKIVVTKDNVIVKTVLIANSSPSLPPTLKQQTDDLVLKSNVLREAAQKTNGMTKKELMAEANELYVQAETMLINALEVSGQKNNETYTLNKANINQLLGIVNISAYAGKEAQSLISDASMNIRLATEMREEANAMPTIESKLGSMSNADEKEVLALGDQNQVIHILKTYAANLAAGIDLSSYAAK
ncbi:MAG TPA: hypothetical protein VN026_05945 [Bacteroidia bacterium]|jgi:hypothetical protein|nr:hypothetical protein [Bacteroidia bacterium]